MKNIGGLVVITTALRREAAPFIGLLGEHKIGEAAGWEIHLGKINGVNFAVSRSGCGKVFAAAHTQLMIDRFCPQYLINYGTAGAISPQVFRGEVVLGKKSIEIDFHERMAPGRPRPESIPDPMLFQQFENNFRKQSFDYVNGTILCQDGDLVSGETKKALWDEYKGDCVCWEGTAVGRTCNFNEVPHVQLRGITDLANDQEQAYSDFESAINEVSEKLVEYILVGMGIK